MGESRPVGINRGVVGSSPTSGSQFSTTHAMRFGKRQFKGGLVAFIGFLLSPLSWWNDLFVNIPIAVAFAWLVSLIYKPAFEAAVVIGYWLTNVLGFVLMHKGARQWVADDKPRPYSRRDFLKDVLTSLAYTA